MTVKAVGVLQLLDVILFDDLGLDAVLGAVFADAAARAAVVRESGGERGPVGFSA